MLAGIDAISEQISKYVQVVEHSSGVSCKCPVCLSECIPGGQNNARMVVALSRCNHQIHLDCLNSMLKSQPNAHQVKIVSAADCLLKIQD